MGMAEVTNQTYTHHQHISSQGAFIRHHPLKYVQLQLLIV